MDPAFRFSLLFPRPVKNVILNAAISIPLCRDGEQGESAGTQGRQGAEPAPLGRVEGTSGGLQVPGGGIGVPCQLHHTTWSGVATS
jgi:hypothetical protein